MDVTGTLETMMFEIARTNKIAPSEVGSYIRLQIAWIKREKRRITRAMKWAKSTRNDELVVKCAARYAQFENLERGFLKRVSVCGGDKR